ncbi:hypothetical protein [Syntrophomonas palmitatica]|uniref:hypothetical protein n=1 Tax=Syntrophomonas palmitatica TaxID=402877 RepID=UPI0006D1F473|nr:hypothetical protein [Syntrophomonas palmitatica]
MDKKGLGRLQGHPLVWLGAAVFFYFGLDLALNDYSPRRTIIEFVIMAGGLLLPRLRFIGK